MKHLPKHLQPRYRYLAVSVECWPDARLTRDALQRELWYAAQNLLGDPGSAAVDPTVMRFRRSDGGASVIMRTRRGESDRARAVIACVSSVDDQPVGLRVTGVSGTIRGCEEKYMGSEPETTVESTVAFENADRPAFARGERLDIQVGDEFVGATMTN